MASNWEPKMSTAGQRVLLTITGPGPSFCSYVSLYSFSRIQNRYHLETKNSRCYRRNHLICKCLIAEFLFSKMKILKMVKLAQYFIGHESCILTHFYRCLCPLWDAFAKTTLSQQLRLSFSRSCCSSRRFKPLLFFRFSFRFCCFSCSNFSSAFALASALQHFASSSAFRQRP